MSECIVITSGKKDFAGGMDTDVHAEVGAGVGSGQD